MFPNQHPYQPHCALIVTLPLSLVYTNTLSVVVELLQHHLVNCPDLYPAGKVNTHLLSPLSLTAQSI